jgi:hypothetical protein
MHLPEELVMKFFEKYLLIATLSSCVLTGGTAFGAESKYYTRVFDASNEVTDAKGTTFETRTVSDGKGHVYSESKSALGDSFTIMDYPTKTMTTVSELAKLIIKNPLRDPNANEPDPSARKDVKSLGTKTINGHPCKGEAYTIGKNKMEVWTGTDINYPVKTIVDPNTTKVTTELKNFSTKPPSDALFAVPTNDYKIIDRIAPAK